MNPQSYHNHCAIPDLLAIDNHIADISNLIFTFTASHRSLLAIHPI
jgi:hypothetical protein